MNSSRKSMYSDFVCEKSYFSDLFKGVSNFESYNNTTICSISQMICYIGNKSKVQFCKEIKGVFKL